METLRRFGEIYCSCLRGSVLHIFDVRKSVHHHTIQINQPTRCTSFTSLLLDVYVSLNMFRAPPRPSSGAYNCTRSLWFYRWSGAVGALLGVVWQTCSSNFSTITEGSRDGLTSARCCNYGCMCSWWWVELPPETCRAVGTAVPTSPPWRKVAETVWPVPDAVITVICAPDDGWCYHPKHVEQCTEI